jgi:hypothetical protein
VPTCDHHDWCLITLVTWFMQSVRDGIDQFRGNIAGTKSRIDEAKKRINGDLGGFIDKKYW